MNHRTIWVDGELLPWGEARIHVLSQSVARGSLVFDVMPCYELPDGPAIFGMREHSERFLRSAALCDMRLPIALDEILAGISATVKANPGVQIVKLNAYYPGVSLDALPVDEEASVAIAAFALGDIVPALAGAKLGTLPPCALQVAVPRKMPGWVLSPQAKIAAGYLYTAVAKQRAREDGFDDVLLLDENGDIAESSTQSFFLVDEGILYTAPTETVLAGITRRCVLELAEDEGLPWKEAHVPAERIEHVQEAFLAGTTTNIWPVRRIDEHKLPEPIPGEVAERLLGRLTAVLAGADPVFSPRWMQRV